MALGPKNSSACNRLNAPRSVPQMTRLSSSTWSRARKLVPCRLRRHLCLARSEGAGYCSVRRCPQRHRSVRTTSGSSQQTKLPTLVALEWVTRKKRPGTRHLGRTVPVFHFDAWCYHSARLEKRDHAFEVFFACKTRMLPSEYVVFLFFVQKNASHTQQHASHLRHTHTSHSSNCEVPT